MTISITLTLLGIGEQSKTKKKQHLLCINENKRIFLFILKFIDYREEMKIGFTLKPRNGNILDFENQVQDLENMGASSAEIPLYELDVISGKKIIQEELNLLQNITGKSKLKFSIHGSMSVNLLDEEYLNDHIEVLKKEIEVCSFLDVNILVTHFGHTSLETSKNQTKYNQLINIQKEQYFELAEIAKKYGVTLCIENIFPYTSGHYTALPSEVSKNISEINHPNARTTIDFSHAYINCNLQSKDLISELETMAPHTEHLHVHDSFGKFKTMDTYIFPEDITYGQGDIHLPLGWGDIPFDKIFSTLSLKKDIFFNFELTHRYKKYYSQNIEKAKKLISLMK